MEIKGETKQINLLDLCNEGVLCINNQNRINFSNQGSQKILKLSEEEILNKTLSELNLEKIDNLTRQRTATKLKIHDQGLIALTSPSFENGDYLGTTIMLLDNHLINKATCHQMYLSKTSKKKTFSEIRKKILITLSTGKKTINQISLETSINWKTVEKHLTYLLGKKCIEEVYNSEYLRIFDLNEKGKTKVEEYRKEEQSKLMYVE